MLDHLERPDDVEGTVREAKVAAVHVHEVEVFTGILLLGVRGIEGVRVDARHVAGALGEVVGAMPVAKADFQDALVRDELASKRLGGSVLGEKPGVGLLGDDPRDRPTRMRMTHRAGILGRAARRVNVSRAP